jgi:hypothetical protein
MKFFLAAFLSLGFFSNAFASSGTTLREVREMNEKLLEQYHSEGVPYVLHVPYVPPVWDYGLEIGSYSTLQNNYWLGFNIGRHVGTCIFTTSETCQQYVDGIVGLGGRESRTHFFAAPSLRWQFVNFPTYWSTFARVFAGGTSSIEPEGVSRRWAYGVGLGVTTYLHPRADMRIEARLGAGSYPFTQVFVSFQFKMDRWVSYFAEKLKAIGVGTVETTGSVIKNTVGTVVDKAGEVTGIKSKDPEGQGPSNSPTATPAP